MPGKKVAKKSASSKPSRGSTTNGAERHATSDAAELLAGRHKAIHESAEKLGAFKPNAAGLKTLRSLFHLWAHHCSIEAEIAYPAFLEAGVEEAAIGEAQIAHDLVTVLMADLSERAEDDELLVAGVRVLTRLLADVIDAGEKSKGLLAAAKEAGVDMSDLGEKIQTRMSQDESSQQSPNNLAVRRLRGVAFSRRPTADQQTRGQSPDREQYGRFLPEHESMHETHRYADHDAERRRYSRSRDDDDDHRSHGRMRDDERSRDARHRDDERERRSSTSRHDDERRHASRSSGHYDDDERRYATRSSGYESERNRGYETERSRQGGSLGDPRDHAEASRRDRVERRSRDDVDYDDDDRRMMRRRRYE